jgi:hypothetical protein
MRRVDDLVFLSQRLQRLQQVILAGWVEVNAGLVEEPHVTSRRRLLLSRVKDGPECEEVREATAASRCTHKPPVDRGVLDQEFDLAAPSVMPKVKRKLAACVQLARRVAFSIADARCSRICVASF